MRRDGEKMQNSLGTELRPDALTGAACAFEGIKGGVCLLNAPTGCKFYTSYVVDTQNSRNSSFDPLEYSERFYFGQPRVPSTYLDEEDYIYGTIKKVEEALRILDKKDGVKFIGIANSSGTSLIGDDLEGLVKGLNLKKPVVIAEGAGLQGSMPQGFRSATLSIVKRFLEPTERKKPKGVNLIGPMICQHNYENDIEEVIRMLSLLGVEVISVISADLEFDSLVNATQAELNIVLYEEYGEEVAQEFEKIFGIPYISAGDTPSPFGIYAAESFLEKVAEFFGIPKKPIEEESKRVRMRCYPVLARASSVRGLPKGTTFGIFGESSQVVPLVWFLHDYLGMYPVVIGLKEVGEKSKRLLEMFLRERDIDSLVLSIPNILELEEALRATHPKIILGSSLEERLAKSIWRSPPPFVGISFPVWGKVTITHRPFIGFRGVLALVEDIINQLRGIISA